MESERSGTTPGWNSTPRILPTLWKQLTEDRFSKIVYNLQDKMLFLTRFEFHSTVEG